MLVMTRTTRVAGFTLIEFMIAITLSLVVLAALTATFVANSRTRTEIERANDQIESGRFSLSTLSSDVELAGFLGQFNVNNAKSLAAPGAKPSPCLSDVAALNANLLIHLQGYDGDAPSAQISPAIPTTCISDVKAGTDVLAIRRAATCIGGTANCAMVTNAPYFQASLCSGGGELGSLVHSDWFRLDTNLANLNRTQRNCATAAVRRQFLTNIYFVANNDVAGDGIPTLKRAELGGDANGDGTADVNAGGRLFAITPVAHGIENMQIEYGIDTTASPGDGAPDVFTASPDIYNRTTPASPFANCSANNSLTLGCVQNWRDVMAIKVTLLARNTDVTKNQPVASNPCNWSGAKTGYYCDTKVYSLGLKADGTVKCAWDPDADGTCDPFLDAYKRHVYSTMVRLSNPAGRRE